MHVRHAMRFQAETRSRVLSPGDRTVVSKQVETALLGCGSLLLAIFIVGLIDRAVSVPAEIAAFKKLPTKSTSTDSEHRHAAVDFSYWSENRVTAYLKTFAARLPTPIALLRISKVNLYVPVLEGTSDVVLNRGVGHIVGTAYPGGSGNIGIAGHRDSFFRVLQHVDLGDSIELQTPARVFHYRITRITIVDPTDVTVLHPGATPSLTLVTCYPFHFVGSAPKRYVVEGASVDSLLEDKTPAQRSKFLQRNVTFPTDKNRSCRR